MSQAPATRPSIRTLLRRHAPDLLILPSVALVLSAAMTWANGGLGAVFRSRWPGSFQTACWCCPCLASWAAWMRCWYRYCIAVPHRTKNRGVGSGGTGDRDCTGQCGHPGRPLGCPHARRPVAPSAIHSVWTGGGLLMGLRQTPAATTTRQVRFFRCGYARRVTAGGSACFADSP
jgi:hypothetical protein